MLVFPNAKINLGLEVLRFREDGYHDIDTVMVPVGIRDALEFVPSKGKQDTYHYTGLPIPTSQHGNTVGNALSLLRQVAEIPPLDIYLHKTIPMGAGMGGGSADGAFMLKALDTHYQLHLGTEVLEGYAARIGSDCPFFIRNTPARATGRGELLAPINLALTAYHILLVYPEIHISTADAYREIKPAQPSHLPSEVVCNMPISEWKHLLLNRFEKFAFENYPLIESLRDSMYENGALYAAMTGSGSAIYGIFEMEDHQRAVKIASGLSYHEAPF